MSTILIAIQWAFIALLARCIYLRYFHPLSRYPGPLFASFTNLWRFLTFFGGKHHLDEQQLHEKYGQVVRTGPDSLSFSSLAGFEAIYGFHKSLEKGSFYDFGRDPHTQAGSIFSARNDALHREHRRKIVGPALTSSKVATYEPVVSKNVSVLLARLEDARTSAGGIAAVNVAGHIHRYTFDTMIEVIYGEPICPRPYTDTKSAGSILAGYRNISKMAWGCAYLPWLGRLMSTPLLQAFNRRPRYDSEGNLTGVSALAAQSRELVLSHPEKSVQSSQPSIVKYWLEVPGDDAKRMSGPEIWRESYNLTVAGPGSTAAALTVVLYELGTDHGRQWQDRIRAELNGRLTNPTSSSVLQAVIKESLRLRAPFPTAFPREIAPGAETAISGLPTPLLVGTTVSSNTYVLGRSKEIWGMDANVWKPQRWLVAEGMKNELEDKFVAFSKGPRMCVGKELAMLTLGKAVAGVLERWNIRSVGSLKGQSLLEMQYSECNLMLTGSNKG